MFRWSVSGQDIIFQAHDGDTGLKAEAAVAGLQDVAAMDQAVVECGRHLRATEYEGPSASPTII